MNIYHVASHSGWFLIKANSVSMARSEGVKKFGRGRVTEVKVAPAVDIKYYFSLKREIPEADNLQPPKIQLITHRQLLNRLIKREMNNGCSAISVIKAETNPIRIGKNGAGIKIKKFRKILISSFMINVDYENAVNNKMVKKGLQKKSQRKFKAQGMKWGEKLKLPNGKRSKALIIHDGKYYLRTTFNLNRISDEVIYMNGSKRVTEAWWDQFFTRGKPEFLKVRNYSLKSIREIHIDGQIWRIK